MGASHVRNWPAADERELLYCRQPDDRDPHRHAVLLLDGDHLARHVEFKSPMLWVFGFFFVFIIGGLSGVMLASVPIDWQVHDTFFIVAHFHYVLIGGAVFPTVRGLVLLDSQDYRAHDE